MSASISAPPTRLSLVQDLTLCGPFSYNARVVWPLSSEDRLAFFDPGDWLRIGPESPVIAILDVPTGTQKSVYRGHHRVPRALGWHPAGDLVASGGVDQNLHIWHAASGRDRERSPVFYGHEYWISSVACDPTGAYVASGDVEGTIHLVDLDRWDIHWTPQLGGWKRVTALAFSLDGHFLLSASQERHGTTTVTLWNVVERKHVRAWQFQQASVQAFAWSPDRRSAVVIGEQRETTVRQVYLVQVDRNDPLLLRGLISAAWMDQGRQLRAVTHDGEIRDYVWTDLIHLDTYTRSGAIWLRRIARELEARGLVECAASGSEDFQRLFPATPVPRSRVTPFFSPFASRIAFVERGCVHFCTVHESHDVLTPVSRPR